MKKTIKICLVAIITFVAFTLNVNAQQEKAEKVTFKVSAQCGMCKDRIESTLTALKGVKKAVVNLDNKSVEITYLASKITPVEMKKAISKAGHDADDVKADPKAYGALPACCKKPEGKK
ncbi:MAG: heavy metal-associated domain-containing protein [Bacteroidota bacterium]